MDLSRQLPGWRLGLLCHENRPHIKSMGLIGAGGVGETIPASIPATAVVPEFLGQGQGHIMLFDNKNQYRRLQWSMDIGGSNKLCKHLILETSVK